MQLADFHYHIPDSLIADQPPATRGDARLLTLDRTTGSIADRAYADICDYLRPGDVLVINDTKVIKARLLARKGSSGSEITRELVLVEKHGAVDDWHRHKVLYRRRLKAGDILYVGPANSPYRLEVEAIAGEGIAIIRSEADLLQLAERFGSVPLPPYMHREATDSDIERYQTVWARQQGSVAAPTASLNMTDDTLQKLRDKGVVVAYATLHVGLGTFLPIRVENVAEHRMHKEYFEVPAGTVASIQEARKAGGRVVALGTTITRTLEYCHKELLGDAPADLSGEADIFMYPGYQFKVIDALLTNFHAPESTVLMLTAAFAGWDKLKPAYQHAVEQRYRFLSYGDSMFIY
jgi:S-adenosylmethionine:tRNA ribosyltransferase-isomerase